MSSLRQEVQPGVQPPWGHPAHTRRARQGKAGEGRQAPAPGEAGLVTKGDDSSRIRRLPLPRIEPLTSLLRKLGSHLSQDGVQARKNGGG